MYEAIHNQRPQFKAYGAVVIAIWLFHGLLAKREEQQKRNVVQDYLGVVIFDLHLLSEQHGLE